MTVFYECEVCKELTLMRVTNYRRYIPACEKHFALVNRYFYLTKKERFKKYQETGAITASEVTKQ